MSVLQVLEAPLEKKAGINYGPPGTKHLVYFVDDLNMPRLDPYETAMPISLIRQHLAWGHWFGKCQHTPLHQCVVPCLRTCMLHLCELHHHPLLATLFPCRPPQADPQEHQQHAVCGVHEPYCWQLCGEPTAPEAVHDSGSGLPRPGQPDDNLWHIPSGASPNSMSHQACAVSLTVLHDL